MDALAALIPDIQTMFNPVSVSDAFTIPNAVIPASPVPPP